MRIESGKPPRFVIRNRNASQHRYANPFKSAVDLDLLGIIFLLSCLAPRLPSLRAHRAKPMIEFLEAVNDVVIKIVEIAMQLAPYGVAGTDLRVTSRLGINILPLLGWYVVAVLGALLFHVAVNISLIIRFLVGMSPLTFFSRIRSALVTAF